MAAHPADMRANKHVAEKAARNTFSPLAFLRVQRQNQTQNIPIPAVIATDMKKSVEMDDLSNAMFFYLFLKDKKNAFVYILNNCTEGKTTTTKQCVVFSP